MTAPTEAQPREAVLEFGGKAEPFRTEGGEAVPLLISNVYSRDEMNMAKISKAQNIVEAARDAKILGVRAGAEHRYTGIWVVVVEDRIFCRSWNDKPTGWFKAFRKQPNGDIKIGEREIPVHAKPVRSARIRDAVTEAFGEKYNTKASRKWVDGFSEPTRVVNTIEFVPE